MNLVLDTNTYRAFMDGNAASVRLIREAEKIWMPVPVLAELRFGFLKGTRGQSNEAILTDFSTGWNSCLRPTNGALLWRTEDAAVQTGNSDSHQRYLDSSCYSTAPICSAYA